MAKKSRDKVCIKVNGGHYSERCIVFDDNGIPWVIDPKKGIIAIAKIQVPAVDK